MKTLSTIMRTALAVMLLLSSPAAFAQKTGYEFTMPKVSKMVTVTKSGVNMRKAPNPSAPRLVNVCIDETDECWNTWSDVRLQRGQTSSPIYAPQGETYLVIKEVAGWYGISVNGMMAYISKQFTKEVAKTDITPEKLRTAGYFGYDNLQVPGVSEGKYRGFVLLDIGGFETDGFLLGHLHDGFIVFTHNFPLVAQYNEANKATTIKKSDSGYGWDIVYGKASSLNQTNDYGTRMLDVNKINDAAFAQILNISGATSKPNEMVTIMACINGEFRTIANMEVKDIPVTHRIMVRY